MPDNSTVAQSRPALCNPMNCGCKLPGSSVDGILQATVLERAALSYSGDLRDSGVKHASLLCPAFAGGVFTTEPPGKLMGPKSN